MNPTPEQQHAIDESGSNIIVSAGAGSGKTAVLTQRTMRILKEGTHINELLILTFTKAAAAEMKTRIRKAIKQESLNNEKLLHELELIDQSYITTFDSYALSVVKKYHYLLNLPNDIGISDASIIDMQKIKIMDEVFENNYKNPSEEFTRLIYDFCVKDDREIKKQITRIATKIDGLPNRKEYLQNYEDNFLKDSYIDKLLEEYTNILNTTISEIESEYKIVSSYADGNYGSKILESLSPLFNSNTFDEIYNSIQIVKIPALPKGSEEELKTEKETLNNMVKSLKETITTFGNIENIKNNLKESRIYVKAIINIIKEYLEKLHEYKKENELYDFQDIALLSIDILKQNESVREEIKASFKEIMIDEYQDTNDIQETFISMIENNNVYMVGDVKQSIYRFRNANPYIFKNKYDNYSKGNGGVKIDLLKNFRSRDEVLRNINDIFDALMDDKIGGADYTKSHRMAFGFENYIKKFFTKNNHDIRILEYTPDELKKYSDEEIEIFTIIKDIKEKMSSNFQVYDKEENIVRDIKYKDMVILIDRSNDFDLYKKIFEYNAIPLTIYRDEKLTNSYDIYILKNIINYIIKLSKEEYDQEFEYAYTSIARSYLFNIPDQDIFNTLKNKDFNNNEIYQTLSPISKSLNNKDITTIVEEIITNTNMYENIIKIASIETTNKRISILLDIATNLNNLGYDIYSFRDYINEILDSNYEIKYKEVKPDTDSVKIMTIHNSKGLEYPICYFPGLKNEFNFKEMNDRFIIDNNYGIITPIFKEGIYDLINKYIVRYHYKEEEISEKIRLFYVALTRAREQIIMVAPTSEDNSYSYTIIPDSIRRKYNSFSSIMDSIKFKLKKYYEPVNIEKINLTKDYIYNKYKENNIANSKNIFEVKELEVKENEPFEEQHFSKTTHELITKEIKDNMKFGLKVHETLEYIDFYKPNLDIIDNTYIKNKINKFLSLPLLSNLDNTKIYKEYEFIYNEDFIEYHGIIDLMIEREDKIDIIDYKLSNIKDENYLKQLNGYKKYIETLTSKKVNIYLYSIINEQIEEL